MNRSWKRKPTLVLGDFFLLFLLIYPSWITLIGVSIEKKKNHHEQKLKTEANSCSGWFFSSFSIDIPIMNYFDWCFNRKKEKSPWTEVEKGSQLLFWVIFFLFQLLYPSWITMIGVSIEKKKNQPEQKLASFFWII